VVVFSFENRSKKRVVIGSNVPSSMDEKTLIDSMQVSNS
jgi:hypothetical protein